MFKTKFRIASKAIRTVPPVSSANRHPCPARPSKAYYFGAAALIVLMFGMTFQRARVFATEEKLMRDTLIKNPSASEAHDDLGIILAKRNDLPEAWREFDAAVQTDPDNMAAESNLALLMVLQGQLSDATSRLRLLLKTKPFDVEIHLRLADIYWMQRHFRQARYHLEMALRLKPGTDTRLHVAQLCYKMHRFREAAEEFRQVLRVKPDSPEALNNLAWLLATCGDQNVRNGAEAVRCAKHACQLTDLRQPIFMSTLAAAYAESGRFPQAIGMAEKALRLQINAGDARLAQVSRQLLDQYRAGKAFHETISIESND